MKWVFGLVLLVLVLLAVYREVRISSAARLWWQTFTKTRRKPSEPVTPLLPTQVIQHSENQSGTLQVSSQLNGLSSHNHVNDSLPPPSQVGYPPGTILNHTNQSRHSALRIVVVMYTNHPLQDWLDTISIRNKFEYCQFHRYAFFVETPSTLTVQHQASGMHSGMQKSLVCLKHLPRYDYLVWIDTDTWIVNFTRTVEEYVDMAQGAHFLAANSPRVFTKKWSPPLINTGVLLFKNSDHSYRFLSWLATHQLPPKVWSRRLYGSRTWSDQDLFIYWMKKQPTSFYKVIDYRTLQDRDDGGDPRKAFVVHFPGGHKEERMRDYLDRLSKSNRTFPNSTNSSAMISP